MLKLLMHSRNNFHCLIQDNNIHVKKNDATGFQKWEKSEQPLVIFH